MRLERGGSAAAGSLIITIPYAVSDGVFGGGSLELDSEDSSRAHRCTRSAARQGSALAALLLAVICWLAAAGWLWLWFWLCCAASPTRPLPHPLTTPTPTACRAICPEEASVSISSQAVRPWFDVCCRRRLYMPAVSLPLLPALQSALCATPCVAASLLRPCNSTCRLPPHYLTPYIHPLSVIIPTCPRPTSCALLPSTAPPSPWPARYTSNREAMFTTCAHGRPTVPC